MSDPGHISLQHLKEGVGELVAANKVAQPEIDHISMTWFNQQIIDDALPHHEIVVEDFLDFLLSYPAEKDTGSGRLAQVSDLMKRWMARESAENPMYTRRYLFAMQEVDRLLEGKREVSQRPAAPLSQYSQGGQGGNSSSSSGDISANACSAGQDQGNPPTFGRPAVYAQTTGGRQRSLPLKDPVKEEDTLISLLSDATMSPVPVYRPQSDKWNPHRRPPGNYVCKRCSVPGHFVQYCPTSLDPRFDLPPPSDYHCDICKQKGAHFATLCPSNLGEGSLTQQRKRLGIIDGSNTQKTATRESTSRYRDERYCTPPARARSRSRSRSPGGKHSGRDRVLNRSDGDRRAQRPHERRSHAKSLWAGYIDMGGKRPRGEEGRLAYDDVLDTDFASQSDLSSPPAPRSPRLPGHSSVLSGRGGVSNTPGDNDDRTDKFLHKLATELKPSRSPSAEDSEASDTSVASDLSPWNVIPALAALFRGKELAIVNRKANRMTASEMIDAVERTKHTSP